MKNREERSKHFFDSGPLMEEDEDLALYDKVSGLKMQSFVYINPVRLQHLFFFTNVPCTQLRILIEIRNIHLTLKNLVLMSVDQFKEHRDFKCELNLLASGEWH